MFLTQAWNNHECYSKKDILSQAGVSIHLRFANLPKKIPTLRTPADTVDATRQ